MSASEAMCSEEREAVERALELHGQGYPWVDSEVAPLADAARRYLALTAPGDGRREAELDALGAATFLKQEGGSDIGWSLIQAALADSYLRGRNAALASATSGKPAEGLGGESP